MTGIFACTQLCDLVKKIILRDFGSWLQKFEIEFSALTWIFVMNAQLLSYASILFAKSSVVFRDRHGIQKCASWTVKNWLVESIMQDWTQSTRKQECTVNASYVSKICLEFGLWDIEVKKLIIKPHLVLISTNALISGITQQELCICVIIISIVKYAVLNYNFWTRQCIWCCPQVSIVCILYIIISKFGILSWVVLLRVTLSSSKHILDT